MRLRDAAARNAFFAPLDKDGRHRLIEVVARRSQHALTTSCIQRDIDRRLALVAESGRRVDDLVTRCNDLTLQDLCRFLPATRIAARSRLIPGLVHQPKLDGRGGRQNLVELGRVLHAGQLHHDAVDPLSLHERLGNAQLVDTIPERRDVLLDGKILPRANLALGHAHGEGLAVGTVGDQHLRVRATHDRLRRVEVPAVCEPHGDDSIRKIDPVPKSRVAQAIVEVLLIGLQTLLYGRIHIDFEQHVDTAAKIEPETHGIQSEIPHPGRQPGRKCQRNIQVAPVTAAQTLTRRLLVVDRFKAQHGPVVLEKRRFRVDVGRRQRTHEVVELCLCD